MPADTDWRAVDWAAPWLQSLCAVAEPIWPQGHPDPDKFADRQAPLHPLVRKARIVRQGRRQFRVYEGGLGASETR